MEVGQRLASGGRESPDCDFAFRDLVLFCVLAGIV